MPISVFGSYQSVVGMAKESVIGTALNPTRFLPCSPPKPKDDIKFYVDKAFRGLPVEEFGEYPLAGTSTFQLDGPFYPDDPGALLYAVLGQNSTTAAPTATTTTGTNSAGALTLTVTSGTGFVNGMAIIIASGVLGLQESNIIMSGGGTTTLTLLTPLRFTHTAGAAVAGNNMHQMTALPSGALNGTQYNPPSYTLFDNYGEAQRYYPNMYADTFSLKWTSESSVSYQASLVGALSQTPAQAGLTVPSSFAYTAVPPFVGWQGGFAYVPVSSVLTQTSKLIDLALDVKRKITPIYGAYGTQSPTVFLPGIQSVAGKLTLQMQDENEYNVFRNASHPQMMLGLFGPDSFGGSATGLHVQIDNPTWKAAIIDRSKDYVLVMVDFAATYNSTDMGNALFNLTNSKSAANMIN